MSRDVLTGSCACGAVRFEGETPSKFVAHCWCLNCRRAHGAAFVTWLGLPETAFRITAGEDLLVHWASPTAATRSFCGTCGSTLLYRSPRWPGDVHVAVGNLDQGPDRSAKAHVYADRAPSWAPIGDELPRFGGEDGVSPISEA